MSTLFALLFTLFPVSFLVSEAAETSLVYLGCYKKDGEITASVTPSESPESLPFSSNKEINTSANINTNPGLSFSNDPLLDLWFTPRAPYANGDPHHCTAACKVDFFRYAGVFKNAENKLQCLCGSSYGRNGIGKCDNCTRSSTQMCGSETTYSIYDTLFKVPSPPQQIMILQRTENALRISWAKPLASNGPLTGYSIKATPIFSYSQGPVPPQSWEVSDSSQQSYLIGLYPGSQYNVTVSAVNSQGTSEPATAVLWTKIGMPDVPPSPKVVWQDKRKMRISLRSARNTKGPISAYRIAVVDDAQSTFFNKDHVVTWNETNNNGLSYYVAAEFSPEDFPSDFIIGNGGTYNGFYNGPIPVDGHWHPVLGVMSAMDGYSESSYSSSSHDQHSAAVIHRHGETYIDAENNERIEIINYDNSTVVAILWVAIGVSTGILFLCVAVYMVLKLNLLPNRRRQAAQANGRRRSQVENHQLTTRDTSLNSSQTYSFDEDQSVAAYTHAGFIPDEDLRSVCLKKLQEVWYVPRHLMDIPTDDEDQNVKLINKGRFGPVYLSTLKTNGTPVTLYTIPSNTLKPDDTSPLPTIDQPEKLYASLDELVRLEKHENVVQLLGFMEDKGVMFFVIEFGGAPLKTWLLQYREFDEASNPPVTPYSLLLCAMNIAEGMYHLQTHKVTHGQLASWNILITDIEVPKISGFGMLSTNPLKDEKDYTRWSAVEQFQNRCVKACDSWGFGILLWEIASLGGTPYYEIKSEDFVKRVCRGARPTQIEVMGDALYQIMLHCWQLDRDERPDFCRLSCSIHELLPHCKENLFISPSFNYPPYIHQYEHLQ